MCSKCGTNNTICSQVSDCSCPVKDLSTDCVQYTGDDLVYSGIKKGTILTEFLQQLDNFVQNAIQQNPPTYLNDFTVGSVLYPVGTVVTQTNTSTKYWSVIINGVPQKILLA